MTILRFEMPESESMNPIFENNSFVVFTTQSDFVYFLCVNIMSMRADDYFVRADDL